MPRYATLGLAKAICSGVRFSLSAMSSAVGIAAMRRRSVPSDTHLQRIMNRKVRAKPCGNKRTELVVGIAGI